MTVYRGDPLGSVAAIGSGGIEVVSRPRLLLTAGQSGYFQVGQTIPPENSLSMRLNCTPAPGGLIETMFETHVVEFAPPPPGIGGGLVEMRKAGTSQSRITARPAAPVTIRLTANSPTDQTWAVLTVTHFQGPPQLVAPAPRQTAPVVPPAPVAGR
ncbi:MAG: hypothetical protein U0871_07310 [Gemmataceae bacterium]